jgi:hypothetical protein
MRVAEMTAREKLTDLTEKEFEQAWSARFERATPTAQVHDVLTRLRARDLVRERTE